MRGTIEFCSQNRNWRADRIHKKRSTHSIAHAEIYPNSRCSAHIIRFQEKVISNRRRQSQTHHSINTEAYKDWCYPKTPSKVAGCQDNIKGEGTRHRKQYHPQTNNMVYRLAPSEMWTAQAHQSQTKKSISIRFLTNPPVILLQPLQQLLAPKTCQCTTIVMIGPLFIFLLLVSYVLTMLLPHTLTLITSIALFQTSLCNPCQ